MGERPTAGAALNKFVESSEWPTLSEPSREVMTSAVGIADPLFVAYAPAHEAAAVEGPHCVHAAITVGSQQRAGLSPQLHEANSGIVAPLQNVRDFRWDYSEDPLALLDAHGDYVVALAAVAPPIAFPGDLYRVFVVR